MTPTPELTPETLAAMEGRVAYGPHDPVAVELWEHVLKWNAEREALAEARARVQQLEAEVETWERRAYQQLGRDR